MSIGDQVNILCEQGRLLRLRPWLPGAAERRELYVTPEFHQLLIGPSWIDEDQEIRWGRLRQDLDKFTQGRLLTVRRQGKRKGDAYMLRLHDPAHEVWEIRSVDPDPGVRVFGRFALKDVFIALLWADRPALGAWGDPMWGDAIVQCKTDWRNLFYSFPPMIGSYPHDYLSNATLV